MKLSSKKLFVISAPSGAGKTTIFKIAAKAIPELKLSISYTTRKPREGEIGGEDYFFIDPAEFERMIGEGRFLEWAKVHKNYYGTSKDYIKLIQDEGRLAILDIDVQGAMQIKALGLPDIVYIFIMPPSMAELEARLRSRGTEVEEDIETRLNNAKAEMAYQDRYDYIVVNDDLEIAARAFIKCLMMESVDKSQFSEKEVDSFVERVIV